MKKILFALIVLALSFGVTYYVLVLKNAPEEVSPSNEPGAALPIGGTQGNSGGTSSGHTGGQGGTGGQPEPGNGGEGTITIRGSGGESLEVSDFMNNGDTVEDTANLGSYYLGNSFPTVASPDFVVPSYTVTYIAATQFFNVVLYKQPLRQSRQDAESYLRQTLGLSLADLCSLNYAVSVPGFVDEAYTSRDLRFSACPNAVPLP